MARRRSSKRSYSPKRRSASYKTYKAPRGKRVSAGRSGTLRIVVEAPQPRAFPAAYQANGVLVGPSDPRPKRSRF